MKRDWWGIAIAGAAASSLSWIAIARAEDALAGCVRELIDYGVTPNVAAEACTRQQPGTSRPSPGLPDGSSRPESQFPKIPQPRPASATPDPASGSSALAFSCQRWEGQPTTMARTQRGLLPLIVWRSEYFSAGGFTPESRCQIVSSRFQQHAERDNLRFISHGTLNAQKVLCVADRQTLTGNSHNYECQAPLAGSLLLTLEAQDDPEAVLSELFAVAGREDWGAVVFRGGNRFGIDLEAVLEEREPVSASNRPSE